MVDLKALLKRMLDNMTVTEGTTSITTTTGVLDSHVIGRYGRMRQLRLAVHKTTATSAGANVYEGKINTISDRPLFSAAYGCGYIGSACVVASIAQSGDIIVRVTGGQLRQTAVHGWE